MRGSEFAATQASEGRAVVILVTDGEETCDGDPAAEIARLRKGDVDVTLNIVGFGIDEFALERLRCEAATIRHARDGTGQRR